MISRKCAYCHCPLEEDETSACNDCRGYLNWAATHMVYRGYHPEYTVRQSAEIRRRVKAHERRIQAQLKLLKGRHNGAARIRSPRTASRAT